MLKNKHTLLKQGKSKFSKLANNESKSPQIASTICVYRHQIGASRIFLTCPSSLILSAKEYKLLIQFISTNPSSMT